MPAAACLPGGCGTGGAQHRARPGRGRGPRRGRRADRHGGRTARGAGRAAGLGWSSGYEALAARNPGLVHCTVTAFGSSGELSWLPPYDGVVEARWARTSIWARRSPGRRPPTGPGRTPAMRPPTSWCSRSPRRCWSANATGAASTSTSFVPGAAGLRIRQRAAPARRARRARPAAAGDGRRSWAVPPLPGLPVQGRPVDADHQQHRAAVPALDGGHRTRRHLGRSAVQGRPGGHPRPRGEG